MKSSEIQKIVDEVLEGNQKTIDQLPELLEDEKFRKQYLALMIDESLIATAVELEAKNKKFKKSGKKPLFFKVLSAVAAIVICVFGVFYFNSSQPDAVVISGTDRYPQGLTFGTGADFRLNQSEELLLELSDKSRLNLKGPFTGRLIKSGIQVGNGFLAADICKRERNKFSVKTENCDIEVLGTKFSVSVVGLSTQLEVDEGAVKINKDSQSLNVLKGEFAVAAPSVPFKVFNKQDDAVPDAVWQERYRHQIEQALKSKNLLCLYDFSDDKTLKNLAGDFLHGEIPVGLETAKGRHGKGGLKFEDSSGLVVECGHLEKEKLANFTALIWCKAEGTEENNVLLSQRDFDSQSPGGWSIHVIDGYLTVWLVTGIRKNGVIEWAKKRIAPFPINQWKQIGVTVEGNDVSVYLDGKKVKEMNINWRPSRHITHLAVGGIDEMSFLYQNFERPRNIFNGVIDEVRIYKESLSESEVLNIFESGKP